MDYELIKLPANELLDKFGSGGHKPGSGSAAALLGLVCCKLIQTVVTLSSGRDEYKGVSSQLTLANQSISENLEPKLLSAVQEDSEQFDKVIVLRRQRDAAETGSNERRNLADRALNELRTSTEIPLNIAEMCLELAEQAILIFDIGFKAARGDSGVAISSALSGASGALSVVYLNLTSFKGGQWARDIRARADEITEKTQRLQLELFNRISRLQDEAAARENES